MTRILAIADEVEPSLYSEGIAHVACDLIVSCGDLPFDYLEYLVTMLNVPLVYVPGNHDPDVSPSGPRRPEALDSLAIEGIFGLPRARAEPPGPRGCTNADGRIVEAAGLTIAGLGGSQRYSEGPNQYDEVQMARRARRLARRAAWRRLYGKGGVDVLIAHSPPLGLGDRDDLPHRGFQALIDLASRLEPRFLIHGHVHPHGRETPEHAIGSTAVVNAVPKRLLEV